MKNLFPALAVFGVTALGAMALANTMNSRVEHMDAKPALAEAVETTPLPNISAHQVRTASLRKESDGHYWATAYVNKMPVKFLVDTGATLVALTQQDARRIGLNTDKLKANAKVRTASGEIDAAVATIDLIEIDGVAIKNVQAVVIEKGLEHSLLGMSFLNRLHGWDVTANAIVIRQ